MRVMIVDGDPVQAAQFESWLNEVNIECLILQLAEEAIDLLNTEHFDCVIFSRSLPDMTVEELLANLVNPNMPIVVTSNTPMGISERLRMIHKVDALLIKPFNRMEFIEDVSSMIDPYDMESDNKTLYYYTLSLNVMNHNVACDNQPTNFNIQESLILEILMRHADELVSNDAVRDFMYQAIGVAPTNEQLEAMVKRMGNVLLSLSGHRYVMTIRHADGHRLWHPPWMRLMPANKLGSVQGQ